MFKNILKKIFSFLPHKIQHAIWSFLRGTSDRFLFWPIQSMKISGMSWIHYIRGVYEPEDTELYKKIIKPGWTVVDIGADVGYFSILLSSLVGPSGLVYAMEPYGWRYFNYLLKNVIKNKCSNIIPMMLGAGKESEIKAYYPGSRSVYQIYKTDQRPQHIRCVSLDDLFGNVKIDLIKIDAEGSELEALRGMEKVLDNNNLKLVIECNPRVFEKAGLNIQDMFDILKRHGFKFYTINKGGLIENKSDSEIIGLARANKYINFLCSKTDIHIQKDNHE